MLAHKKRASGGEAALKITVGEDLPVTPCLDQRLRTLSPLPENLLAQPLEYLGADHFRLETLGRILVDASAPDRVMEDKTRDTLLRFLEVELPRHLNDEEDDLFPLIDAHCPVSSPLHPLVNLLKSMHRRLDGMRADLAKTLNRDATDGRTAHTFGELLHWNIAIEDSVVMPLASTCLAVSELDFLAHAMSARRQVVCGPTLM